MSGQWDPEFGSSSSNGAILFTPNLQIGNGRHRLAAVDLADWPITVYVERCQWGPYMGPPLGRASIADDAAETPGLVARLGLLV